MCLVLFAINQHPLFPLIVVSNRDEFYERASASAHFWPEHPHIFAGMDLVKLGTWLGVTRRGDLSLVTNYRNPAEHKPLMESRGLLVKNFLVESDSLTPYDYIKKIIPEDNHYNLFNLLVGNPQDLYYYSNVNKRSVKLCSGLYGLSNHLLDTPWFKVERAKQFFLNNQNELSACRDPDKLRDLLFPMLSDKTLAPDDSLPQTGMPWAIEKLLSSVFVDMPDYHYGTTHSTVILFGNHKLYFSEKTFDKGRLASENTKTITRVKSR
jgi:uncharacterized protein with NRDE domain